MNKSRTATAASCPRENPAISDEAAAWIARRDGGLTALEQEQFNRWCSAHSANREVLQRLDGVWQNLDRPLQSGAADLLLGELQVRSNRRRHRRVGLAASAAVLLFAATFGWQYWSRPASVAPSASTQAVLHLPAVRSLPDGSVVELADNSDLSVEFSPAVRRVVLHRGQAHFQVTKNPAHPFIVAAGGIEVRAVGTAFVVQLGSQDMAVLVTEGRVAVDATIPAAPAVVPSGSPTVLAMVDAGNGVSISLSEADFNKVRPLSDGELADRTAWRRPRLEFSGTPLLEAVAMMNRQNPVQLHIENPAVGQLRISGIFGAQNTDSFVRSLENTFDLKAERRSENEIVLRRAP